MVRVADSRSSLATSQTRKLPRSGSELCKQLKRHCGGESDLGRLWLITVNEKEKWSVVIAEWKRIM
jgi:hypothetical protein